MKQFSSRVPARHVTSPAFSTVSLFDSNGQLDPSFGVGGRVEITQSSFYLIKTLAELSGITTEQLLDSRYEKFRRMGVFLDQTPQPD